jgi:6-phosphofructokinase 2
MTILTVTLNPAIDVSTAIDQLRPEAKLRCSPPRFEPGGGGVNVSRAIAKLGGTSTPFAAVGGATGEMYKRLLESEGHRPLWFAVDGMTRQSLAVTERCSQQQYRFVLPGPDWSEAAAERALAALGAACRASRYVVGSGSLPPGAPLDFYDRLNGLAEAAGAHFVLDTSGGALTAELKAGRHRLHAWVMDNAEAVQLAGRPLPDMAALEDFARTLWQEELAHILILTYAQGGAVAVSKDGVFTGRPPKVEVVSKVGAGDSFVGGLVLKLAEGWPLPDACRYAMAAAASAVTTPASELCSRESTERFFGMIKAGNPL